MCANAMLPSKEIDQLRRTHYNADVIDIHEIHEDLRIVRVRPDWGEARFAPGQYSTLGLGNWEARATGCQAEQSDEVHAPRLLKRAYSFSCPMLDGDGRLEPPEACQFLEFYIVLIRHGEKHPPGLTPRIFAMNSQQRMFVGSKVTGHYTLDRVAPEDDVFMIGTGTGEAPHNAMLAHLLANEHRGRLVCVTCARYRRDLGYATVHRELERRYPQYRYLTLTTRETENLDPQAPNYVGKRYLQDYVESGDLERDADVTLSPERAQVFLCGNPAMIGAPRNGKTGDDRYPKPRGMVEVLEQRGFRVDEPSEPGNIHFEKYW